MRHTLLPYYSAFTSPERRGRVLEAMLRAGSRPHIILGKRSGWLEKRTHLKFCPDCVSDMRARDQELHWLRIHQLPVVLACPKHTTWLRRGPRIDRGYIYIRATDELCRPDAPACLPDEGADTRQAFVEIARLARDMLHGTHFKGGHHISSDFGQAFRALGYRRGASDRVDFLSLAPAARQILAPLAVAFPRILDENRTKPVWLDHLVDGRTAEQADSVLMGLYVLRHLKPGPYKDDPFGQPPWPCLNPLAGHRAQHVVHRIQKQHRLPDGGRRARFHCSCGCSYARTRRPDGSLTDGQIYRIGPLLGPFVEAAIESGLTLTAASRRLGVEPKTLRTLARREGLDPPWAKRAHRSEGIALNGTSS